jgi:hypothetical protein
MNDETSREACAREASARTAAATGDSDAAFELGLLLAQRGAYAEAEQAYALAAESGHPEAGLNLASLYASVLDRPDEARRLYQVAVERGDLRAMFDLAFMLWRAGDQAGAEAALRLAGDTGCPLAHLQLGLLLADQRRDDDALEAFRHAVAGGEQDAWLQVGWQLARLGRLEEARGALDKARGEAANPVAGAILRDVLVALGDEDTAESVFAETVAWARRSVSLRYRDLLGELDGEDSREQDLKAWAKEELDPRAPLELAALLFDTARLAAAETRLRLAAKSGVEEARRKLTELYDLTGRAPSGR